MTFRRIERLKSRKTIGSLFPRPQKDKEKVETTQLLSLSAYPMRLVWARSAVLSPFPVQLAVSVSKRSFKKAVTRNLLKRRIREAYRLQKEGFYEQISDKQYAFMVIYTAKEVLPYEEIAKGIRKMFRKFITTVEEMQEKGKKND